MTESIDFKIPTMRTAKEIYEFFKAKDPKNSLSERYIRELANTGQIVCKKNGRKTLINLEKFIEFLNTPTDSIQKAAGNNKYGISQIN